MLQKKVIVHLLIEQQPYSSRYFDHITSLNEIKQYKMLGKAVANIQIEILK